MTLSRPEALFLGIPLLLALGYVLIRTYRIRKSDLELIVGEWRSRRFLTVYYRKSLASGLCLISGFLCIILALSGLSWGSVPQEDPRSGLDVALVLDVSRSMDARDISPSRLAKATAFYKSLLANLPSARFSLTVYKGSAKVMSPLTQDTLLLDNLLDSAGSSLISTPGSRPDLGLESGLSTFNFPSIRYKILLIATDGENWQGNPLAVAQTAARQDRKILVLGTGTPAGSVIPVAGGVLKDGDRPVETRLDDGFLRTLASAGRGEYFDISEPGTFERVKSMLMEISGNSGGVRLESVDHYRTFLLAGLFFLTLSMVVRIVRWKQIL